MVAWEVLLSLLILFGAALVLGTLAEELKQSAIIGYLTAGMLVGPNVLGWFDPNVDVTTVADLGVALLMFTLGIEFSLQKLIRLGRITLLGGTGQVVITAGVAALIFHIMGYGWGPALAVGSMISMTSTACMVRSLTDITQLDSLWGRSSIAISLLQDVAMIPLAVMIVSIGTGGSNTDSLIALGRTLAVGLVIYLALFLLINYLIPRLLVSRSWSRNRELPVIMSIVVAAGSAWLAHQGGLSPAFGAFIAGLLLSSSPYAVQIRADVLPLRSLLVTFFFASIGLMVDPAWILQNPLITLGMTALVLLIKPLVVFGLMLAMRYGCGVGIASGLCHAQVGEFSIVLAGIALGVKVIDLEVFKLVVSVAVLSLFINPYLVKAAPTISRWVEGLARRCTFAPELADLLALNRASLKKIIIVGFGPAGQRAAERLYANHRKEILVLDMNPRNARIAESYGLDFMAGDARSRELLEHVIVDPSQAMVLTLPDAEASRMIIHQCKAIAPGVRIFARARYHVVQWDLLLAGAEAVVSEEDEVGSRLAEELLAALHGEELPGRPNEST